MLFVQVVRLMFPHRSLVIRLVAQVGQVDQAGPGVPVFHRCMGDHVDLFNTAKVYKTHKRQFNLLLLLIYIPTGPMIPWPGKPGGPLGPCSPDMRKTEKRKH